MCQGNVPEWMVRGRTVDTEEQLTGIMGEKVHHHLEGNGLLVEEQKGCRKESRGTKDQLLVDKAILKNCRTRLTNLSMAWIDYREGI